MGELQSNEDPAFQERFWVIQRFAWGLGAGILVLAIAGATGSGGVFASRSIGTGKAFHFDRVARVEAPTRLIFRPDSAEPSIFLSQSYLDHVRLLRIQPPPNAIAADATGVSWRYRDAPSEVRIDVIPEDSGTIRGTAGVGPGDPLPFTQRVLP